MTTPAPLTIGMPVYNSERFLALALESILTQTFGDFALVISDNASTDSTQDIVLAFARRDARISYFRNSENRGAAWNFNHAFSHCRSPLFRWAASDDMLAPTNLERCVELLDQASEEVVLVAPQTRWIDSEGLVLPKRSEELETRHKAPHARLRYVVANAFWGNPIFGVIRSEAMRRTRGLGGFPSSDWVLLVELALLGEFWVLPEPLFLRREHEGMSRQKHSDLHELRLWHDPGHTKPEPELRRVCVEYLKGIKHVPLSRAERSLCYAVAVGTFLQRHSNVRRRIALRTRLRRLIGRVASAVGSVGKV